MKLWNLGNLAVNQYLYQTPEGCVLVDTGYEGGYRRFLKRLRRLGLGEHDLTYLFLTHAHNDHAGFLNELLTKCPHVRVILSQRALEGVLRGDHLLTGGCTSALALLFCKGMSLFRGRGWRFPPLEPALIGRCLVVTPECKSDLEQRLCGRIYETPGHTDCSLSLLLDDGALFCGDAAMNGLPSLRNITIWVGDRDAYCASWEQMIALCPVRIYPGHGRPFSPGKLADHLPFAQGVALRPLAAE